MSSAPKARNNTIIPVLSFIFIGPKLSGFDGLSKVKLGHYPDRAVSNPKFFWKKLLSHFLISSVR